MFGQWIAIVPENGPAGAARSFTTAMLNIDQDRPNKGRILLNNTGGRQAEAVVEFAGDTVGSRFDADVERIDPPGNIQLPAKVTGQITALDNSAMDCDWQGSWGERGTVRFVHQDGQRRHDAHQSFSQWRDFKNWAEPFAKSGWLFRGQTQDWQIQSSLHRLGISDLSRYRDKAVPHLIDALAAIEGEWVTRSDPILFASMLALAQHHGFPTPLIDWSRSPYVAAYFALCECPANGPQACPQGDDCPRGPPKLHARIAAFNAPGWVIGPYRAGLTNCDPFIHVHTPIPISNPRWMAQQAVSTSTNLAAPEIWLRMFESLIGKQHLITVDLPYSLKAEAMTDLKMMGITAATMFPGRDGVCRAVKENLFGHLY